MRGRARDARIPETGDAEVGRVGDDRGACGRYSVVCSTKGGQCAPQSAQRTRWTAGPGTNSMARKKINSVINDSGHVRITLTWPDVESVINLGGQQVLVPEMVWTLAVLGSLLAAQRANAGSPPVKVSLSPSWPDPPVVAEVL